jgi:gliding motility-associated-like protein
MRYLRPLLCIMLFWFVKPEAKATHLVGGFASYEYLGQVGSNFRYRVRLTAYRDCTRGDQSVGFDETIGICIYNKGNNLLVQTATVPIGPKSIVQPLGNTSCPQNTQACIERGLYTTIVTLPASNAGYILKWERCCRNTQVNLPDSIGPNGVLQPALGQTYLTEIPPTSIRNSSPFFTDVPVPFICVNDTAQIRNLAQDPDGDSLVYRLVRPWKGGSLTDAIPLCEQRYNGPQFVEYRPGFSFSQPFGPNGFADVNPLSGTLTALARQTGNYALAVDVEEYRNGVLLSRVRLDIQLLVINCPPNQTPFLSAASSNFNREVIAGTQLCFDVTGLDNDDGQTVTLKGFGELLTGGAGWQGPTATFTTSSGVRMTTSRFCWTPSCEQARSFPYSFVVEVLDNGCPSKFRNETYNITVRKFVSNASINGRTPVCESNMPQIYVASNVQNGSTLEWFVEGGTIVTGQGTNNVSVLWDFSQASGKITLRERSQGGCLDKDIVFPVAFLPRPELPTIDAPEAICLGEPIRLFSPTAAFKYNWILPTGVVVNTNPYFYTPPAVGAYTVRLVSETVNACPSDTASFTFNVVIPLVADINGPTTVCPNNGNIAFYVEGLPGSTFKWIVDSAIIERGQGTDTVYLRFGGPGNYKIKVLETTKLGCKGDTIEFDVVATYDLILDRPIGTDEVCEFTQREMYKPKPFVFNTIYYWSVNGGDIDEIDSLFYTLYVNWGAQGLGRVSYYQTAFDTLNSKQCVSNTVVLDVLKHPIPVQDKIEGVFEVCQFTDSLVFTVNGFSNSTYSWSVNNRTDLSGQGTESIRFSSAVSDTFFISVVETSQNACVGQPIDSVFIIHPKPVTTPILGPAILCHPDFSNKRYAVIGFETSTFYWHATEGLYDTLRKDTVVIDWDGKEQNRISVVEVSDFGCRGDSLFFDVFIDSPGIAIRYVTVAPPPEADNKLIVAWELINGGRYDTTFSVFKRSINPETDLLKIGETDKDTRLFTESKVNTDLTPFEFQIVGYDLCRNKITSDLHTSILLTGRKPIEYEVEMEHSAYLGWQFGVSSYELHRKLLNKTGFDWYDANPSPIVLSYKNGTDHYTQCYRIKAIENNGRLETSWSNEICFDFPPLFYIPNAFSPNGNNLNELFGPVTSNLKTFRFAIYNRWGEKLYETNQPGKDWDGTFKGVPSPQGVYMYTAEFTDFTDKPYQMKGTFHLLR